MTGYTLSPGGGGGDERARFVALARRHGSPAPAARVLDLQEPLPGDGQTDCWTYAHRHALANPGTATYVEGVCHLPPEGGRARVAAHAWVEEDTPFGRRVREFTPGYERAFGYVGLAVDLGSDEARRAEADGHRYSVIELTIALRQAGLA